MWLFRATVDARRFLGKTLSSRQVSSIRQAETEDGSFVKNDGYIGRNEKNPGWLGYIRDEILPTYGGIIINHYNDPYFFNQYNGK